MQHGEKKDTHLGHAHSTMQMELLNLPPDTLSHCRATCTILTQQAEVLGHERFYYRLVGPAEVPIMKQAYTS